MEEIKCAITRITKNPSDINIDIDIDYDAGGIEAKEEDGLDAESFKANCTINYTLVCKFHRQMKSHIDL